MAPPKKTMPPPPSASTTTTATTAAAENDQKKNKQLLPQHDKQEKQKKTAKRVHFAEDDGLGTRSQSEPQTQTRLQPPPAARINRTNDRRRTLRSVSTPVRSSASIVKRADPVPSVSKKGTRNVMAISSILNESEGHSHDNRSSVKNASQGSGPAEPEPTPEPSLPDPTTASTDSQPLTTKDNKKNKPSPVPETIGIKMRTFEDEYSEGVNSIDNPIEFFQQWKQLQYEQAILDILGDLQLPFV